MLALLASAGVGAAQQPPSAEAVEPFLDVQRARALAWAPDGSRIDYQLGGVGTGEIRVSSVADDSTAVAVAVSRCEWRPGGAVDLRWADGGERLPYRAGSSYYTEPAHGSEAPERLMHPSAGRLRPALAERAAGQLHPGRQPVGAAGVCWCAVVPHPGRGPAG